LQQDPRIGLRKMAVHLGAALECPIGRIGLFALTGRCNIASLAEPAAGQVACSSKEFGGKHALATLGLQLDDLQRSVGATDIQSFSFGVHRSACVSRWPVGDRGA